MSNPIANMHYVRVLTQFGRLVEGARKHEQMTIDHLSARSGITVRRLMKYATASAPPHWGDALRLARVLDIPMSFIIAAMRRPLLDISLDEHKSLVAFVHAQRTPQRQELQEDVSRDRLIHLEDSSDEPNHDATLADWPEFLPPLLGDALMAEASRLHAIYRVLEMALDHGGGAVPMELESETKTAVPIESGALLSRVHCVLERTCTRLEWLRSRHVVYAPGHFAERLEIQRSRIVQAMRLIAPHWRKAYEIELEQDAATARDLRNAGSMHLTGAESGKFSADLTEALGRAIVASYGVTKMARRSFVVPLEMRGTGAGSLLTKMPLSA
jgi:transcriptional regulator with XRE-family HTH domain